jgi:hypothetical protein
MLDLSKGNVQELEAIVARYPNIGDRYTEAAMKMVNI